MTALTPAPSYQPKNATDSMVLRQYLCQCPSAAVVATYAALHQQQSNFKIREQVFLSNHLLPSLAQLFSISESTVFASISNLTVTAILSQIRAYLVESKQGFRDLATVLPSVAMQYPEQWQALQSECTQIGKLAKAMITSQIVIEALPNIVPDIKQARIVGRDILILRAILSVLDWDFVESGVPCGIKHGDVRIDFIDDAAILTDAANGDGDKDSLRFYGIFP